MPDEAFVDFAFAASVTGAQSRTMRQRIADMCNVAEFFPSGTITDHGPYIQKAIDAAAAHGGGTIFFPPGGYTIGSRLIVPTSPGLGLDFLGCGSDAPGAGGSGGTVLGMSVQDYILYTGHYSGSGEKQSPIKSIRGIGFINSCTHAAPTSTEPPSSGGDGFGCIYLGSGINPVILNCSLSVTSGVGIFSAAENIYIGHTPMQGALVYGTWNKSILLLMAGGGFYGHAKPYAAGHAMVGIHRPCSFHSLDLEVSGVGIRIGSSPIDWWNPDTLTVKTAGDASEAVDCPSVTSINLEALAHTGYDIRNVTRGSFIGLNHHSSGQVGDCETNFYLRNVKNSEFRFCTGTARYTVAVWDMGGTGSQSVSGNVFEYCGGSVSDGGGVELIPCTSFAAGDDPNTFVGSFTSPGLTVAQLPPSPTYPFSEPVLVTDCTFALWTGSVSNAGKTLVGGSTNHILARWNGANWIAAA